MNRTKYTYDSLALEGGGICGLAECSAIEELHKRGVMAGIDNFAGSSVGSMIAGALACGASYNFLQRMIGETDFSKFVDYYNKGTAMFNIWWKLGACTGDPMTDWYAGVIRELTGDADITLGKIHDKYGGKLVVTTTCLTDRKTEYLDYISCPDMPLKQAVRMSASFPYLFQPVMYNNKIYVDGGVMNNYPINVFHYANDKYTKINEKALGLMLLSSDQITHNYPPVTNLRSFTSAIIECYLQNPVKPHMDPQDWDRSIKIPCGQISSIDFTLTSEQKQFLMDSGRKSVIEFFDGKAQERTPENDYENIHEKDLKKQINVEELDVPLQL